MNKDILQAAACEKVLNNIDAARKALRDAANPPAGTINIAIRGLDEPITGERSLWLLPPGTSIHIAADCAGGGAVYVQSSAARTQRWMRHDGRQVSGEDMFAAILDATVFGDTITLLSYGVDPL
nr:MAG TPA: hypothetical protein [Caudoviricetes sp.]